MQKMSFTKACADYFGRQPNQNLSEFMAEIKALTPDDRTYFRREFLKVGYEITEG